MTAIARENNFILRHSPETLSISETGHAHLGLKSIPLDDCQIHLEMHLATLACNKSPQVSEYVRTLMKRIEEQRPPLQPKLAIRMSGDDSAHPGQNSSLGPL